MNVRGNASEVGGGDASSSSKILSSGLMQIGPPTSRALTFCAIGGLGGTPASSDDARPVVSKQPKGHSCGGAVSDDQIINSCLAGDSDAWNELYHRFHDPLLATIRSLYRTIIDPNLVEEIAARVWYALIKDEHRLLVRFDPSREIRFTTYLALIVKSQAQQHFRDERRRRAREAVTSKPLDSPCLVEHEIALAVDFNDQFLKGLTPAEKKFYDRVLISVEQEADYTPENTWQLRHRVLAKLQAFLVDRS